MEETLQNYVSMWLKSIDDKKALGQAMSEHKFITINRTRLLEDSVADLEKYLWREFKNSKENLYYLHLRLAEFCLATRFNEFSQKESCVLFLNRTFDNWMRSSQRNMGAKKNQSTDDQTTSPPTDLFTLETYHILKAFDLATTNLNLLTSFNKIYKFDQNFASIKIKMNEFAQKTSGSNLIKLVSELKANDLYPIDYEPIIVPMMISDKYKQIEDMINGNEKTLISVVEVCDKICNENVNLKKIAESYDAKKSNKFKGSQVAKFGLTCLKKIKKQHLIYSTYLGIQFHLKLSQLRFLLGSGFSSTDPMSFDAWSELITDLIGNDERLIGQLFFEIVHLKRDVNLGMYFVQKYSPEYIQRLPEQTILYFEQNAAIFRDIFMKNIEASWPCGNQPQDYYFPNDLTDENIIFVNDPGRFGEMLEFFETKKPDIIGLDCEWKPTFGPDDIDSTDESTDELNSNGDKKKRADLFQIATRDKTFLVEVRDLVDVLDPSQLDKFGELVLFSEEILKLGYNFEQDSHRLSHSFSKFRHRLVEFTQSVINMDEIAADIQRKFKIFPDELAAKPAEKGFKPKGLSKLTHLCFGKPLDKRECMSNWQNRPLRSPQMRYAALDAFVLINIHDHFKQKLNSLNIECDYISNRRRVL